MIIRTEYLFFIVSLLFHSRSCEGSKDPKAKNGRTVMVNLFEWKWTNVADECEKFLGPRGFAAVQISPPNEHAIVNTPFRPWWQRYQPVSYKLISRSGTEEEFVDMVKRCNTAGVRVYVDAVINHMSGLSGIGTAGSKYDGPQRAFPAVPYGVDDFTDKKCKTNSSSIEDFNDADQIRYCMLLNLPNLAIGTEKVRKAIVNYLNKLISIGIAGFRIDSARYMFPDDIDAIYKQLNNLRADIFGSDKRPFIYQEVLELDSDSIIKNTDYTHIGRALEFKYGLRLSELIRKKDNTRLKLAKDFGSPAWNFVNETDAVVFIDSHDNQRGHGSATEVLTFFESRRYKIANVFMLAWPYGFVQLMSSYAFPKTNDAQGPPTDDNGNTKDVTINPDDTCGNGWICEHRWRQITNMVKFRNIAGTASVTNWWHNSNNQIAFSRGNRAFIAINNDEWPLSDTLQTGLPQGEYCDIISGDKVNNACTGHVISVGKDGTAVIEIGYYEENPVIAIHIESKLN